MIEYVEKRLIHVWGETAIELVGCEYWRGRREQGEEALAEHTELVLFRGSEASIYLSNGFQTDILNEKILVFL